MVLNNRFEEPYNKFPGDGPIPLLSKPVVKSKLSKKFWLYSQYLESQNLLKSEDDFSSYDNYNNNINIEDNNNYNNNINNDMENVNKKKFRINYRRPKTSDIKLSNKNMNRLNNNINNNININKYNENRKVNKSKKKYQNQNNKKDIDEINRLNEIILNLQYELNRQDFIINNQINEKMRLQKRINELEKVLKNFC